MSSDNSLSSLEIENLPLNPPKRTVLDEERKVLRGLFCLTGTIIFLFIFLILALVLRPTTIDKPVTDKREYRYIELENQMRMVLVHDLESVMSAASVSVGIGYFADPWDLPGLTHYTEHMVFINSKKYPEVNSFLKLVAENGGYANAQTVAEDTTYYFQMTRNNFEKVVDIFSHFFIDPLFEQEYLDKEVHAVSSEFEQYLNDEKFRFYYLTQLASDRNKVYKRFKCGNVDSLKFTPEKTGINVKQRITEHFNKYYSANIMTGALFGSQSLDELEAMARKYFGQIPNKDVFVQKYRLENLFGTDLPRVLAYTPIGKFHTLNVVFQIKQDNLAREVKATDFVYELLNSDVEGGFKNSLVKRGWLKEISGFNMVNRGATYNLDAYTFTLTEEGSHHTYEILQLYYGFINQLANSEDLKQMYDDILTLKRRIFDYQKSSDSPSETVKEISLNLKFGKPENVLIENRNLRKFNEEYIKDYLRTTLSLQQSLILISSPDLIYTNSTVEAIVDHNQLQINNYNTINEFYRLNYAELQIDPTFLTGFTTFALFPDFTLPKQNIFAPKNLALPEPRIEKIDGTLSPVQIHSSKGYSVWHSQFSLQSSPIAALTFNLYAFDSCLSASQRAYFLIYYEYLKSHIMSIMDYPKTAGYSIDLDLNFNAASLEISGFSDKITLAASYLLNFTKFDSLSPKRFNIFQDSAINQVTNDLSAGLYGSSMSEINHRIYSCYFKSQDILNALNNANYTQYTEALKDIQKYLHLEVLAIGNLEQESLMLDLFPILKSFEIQGEKKEVATKPIISKSAAYKKKSQFGQSNDQISVNYYYGGKRDIKTITVLKVIEPGFNAFVMNELRTKQTLGYVALAQQDRSIPGNGMFLIVQGPEKTPYFFDKEIENVLKSYQAVLENLTEDEIDKMKRSYLSKTADLSSKLDVIMDLWGKELRFSTYDFAVVSSIRKQADSLSKQDIVSIYRDFFTGSSRLSYQVSNDNQNQNSLLLDTETYKGLGEEMISSLDGW